MPISTIEARALFNKNLKICISLIQGAEKEGRLYFPAAVAGIAVQAKTTSAYLTGDAQEERGYVLKEGAKASDAMDDLLTNSKTQMATACIDAITIALYGAFLMSLRTLHGQAPGNEIFNKFFSGLLIRSKPMHAGLSFFSGIVMYQPNGADGRMHPLAYFLRATEATLNGEVGSYGVRPVEAGDIVEFRNTPDYTNHKSGWFKKHQVLCVGRDQYQSFGMPDVMSEAEICNVLIQDYARVCEKSLDELPGLSPKIIPGYASQVFRMHPELLAQFFNQPELAFKKYQDYEREETILVQEIQKEIDFIKSRLPWKLDVYREQINIAVKQGVDVLKKYPIKECMLLTEALEADLRLALGYFTTSILMLDGSLKQNIRDRQIQQADLIRDRIAVQFYNMASIYERLKNWPFAYRMMEQARFLLAGISNLDEAILIKREKYRLREISYGEKLFSQTLPISGEVLSKPIQDVQINEESVESNSTQSRATLS